KRRARGLCLGSRRGHLLVPRCAVWRMASRRPIGPWPNRPGRTQTWTEGLISGTTWNRGSYSLTPMEEPMERRDFLKLSAAATLTLAVEPTWAQTAKTEVHWLGQATTKITTSSGKVIVIDPFLTNNPKTPGTSRTSTGWAKWT